MKYFTDNPLERLMMEVPKAYPPKYINETEIKQMHLVISEKPSVGNAIAAVLGAKNRQDGYIEGCGSPTSKCLQHLEAPTEPAGETGYLVSWCFGHLTELAEPDTYDEKYAKWRYDDLPILPDQWRFAVGNGKQKQFDTLKTLMNRTDVTEIVNACDAGREGELIFRLVYNLAECHKPVKRLWISSMEETAISDGFANLHDGKDYENLYQAALARLKADWLVGFNATRLFSVLYHRKLNVGRVVSPTLALIVQRECEIGAFKPEPFYTVNLECDGFSATSEKFKDKTEADRIASNCGKQAVVKSIERKEKSEKAPALYDLTTLQRDANRTLGYTAQQTLDYLQNLYEKKLCTYPRTDSRYLTDDMKSAVSAIAILAAAICDVNAPMNVNADQVCNSTKVSDHHAVIPTLSAGEANISALPTGEREILKLVCRQMLIAVSYANRYAETTVTVECGNHDFTAKGRTILTQGWKSYTKEENCSFLPDLNENMTVSVKDITVKEGKTTAPAHYTEDTLLSAMENVTDCRGIGTPATRAGILEKLVATGFIERKKAQKNVHLIPSHSGNSLITVLPEQLQSPLLTAEWEQKLSQIERGELEPEVFMRDIAEMIGDLVKNYKVAKGAEVLFPSGREVVGKCPRCGGDVTESKNGFFCERTYCHFGLWRDNKFLAAKKIVLTTKNIAVLLKNGRVPMTGIYSEKTGKTYDATIVLEDDGTRATYKLDFDNKS